MIPASLLISAINFGLTLCGIASLCLTCSIFDFIVMREMYYTVPDTKILIPTEASWWFYGTSVLCVVLSTVTALASTGSKAIQRFAENYPQIFCFFHGGFLCASSILCAFCTFLAMQMSEGVGKYAFHAHPKQFQEASHWYYARLRASAVRFLLYRI
ncbi:hypothetical protein GCK32_019123 [Trichostrongylus colubriformis]|uniref:Uncharacterized protein n=1 Tax=Trichostrongylus colubriformis TaxID=6319 RepID=A0AAN8FNQ7_TRICO